jgi:hypothetical protein
MAKISVPIEASEAFRTQHRVQEIHGGEQSQHERQHGHDVTFLPYTPYMLYTPYTRSQRSISAYIAAKTTSARITMPIIVGVVSVRSASKVH